MVKKRIDCVLLPYLDQTKSLGRSTGLVVTSDITHATPTAFAADVHNRKCEEEIARQYLRRQVDVLLGGGIAANRNTCLLTPSSGNWLDALLTEYKAVCFQWFFLEKRWRLQERGG